MNDLGLFMGKGQLDLSYHDFTYMFYVCQLCVHR